MSNLIILRKFLFVLLLACILSSCGKKSDKNLILYCGAGIRPAALKLIAAFEKVNPDIKISATYAGSGRLLGQLTAARKGDLFMPGSAFYVEKAVADNLADVETRRDAAYFIPVILVQKGNPMRIKSLNDLVNKKIRLGLGDERAVAVGKQSMKIFKKNNITIDKVKQNLKYVSGTVNELGMAIELKNIDAAIVWDANAKQYAHAGDSIEIPMKQNIPVTIPIVILSFSKYPEVAQKFINFVTSKTGIDILKAQKYTTSMGGK